MVDSIEVIETRTKYDWKNGPDQTCPADSYVSNQLSQPVKLRLTDGDLKRFPPISIYGMFERTVKERPHHDSLAYKPDPNGEWVKFSFEEYWKMCHKAAKSFIQLGLDVSECVSILGFNAPQWFIAQLGAIFAGAVGCGIYTTNSVEQIEYILRDTGSKIVVVENKTLLEKVMSCKNTSVSKIIQYSGEIENDYNGLVLSWKTFIDMGLKIDDLELKLRVKTIAPNKCASLIYTSGTTGNPKAAMISHDNITYLVRYMCESAGLRRFNERFISYLPLSHIAAQLLDIYAPLGHGITVYFAQPDALKGSLNTTLKQVRPTYFFGVPRVWEKIQEGIEKNLKNLTGFKLTLFKWAQKSAYEETITRFNGHASSLNLSYQAAKVLVLNNVHSLLGLDQCRTFYSGAAPITKETLEFFYNLGIPVCEVYGMSESTGPHSIGTSTANKITSVGQLQKFNHSKIDRKEEDGSGELLVSGRHVFMGYLNDLEKTDQAFDSEGWLHTGDLAKITDNYLYITGRLKELIITAGGENIAPIPIEDSVKSELSKLISNCMVVGDKKKYLVILVTLKCKVDINSMEPLNELTPECISYLESIGSRSRLVTDIIDNKDPKVYNVIEEGIKRANKKSISRAAVVQKFAILPRDFSLFNGELGPTLKLRRPHVTKMYAQVIDNLYKDDSKTD